MKNLIYKELRLATPLLTFLFLAFSLMTFIPGYPILCGAFFMSFGIFQAYQLGREDNDILYSVLLPVSKRDVVKGKYLSAVILQLAGFALCAVFTLIRMRFMADAPVYESNFMMNANLIYLAFVLLIFAAFNHIFIAGFFKSAYAVGKPFVIFVVMNFLIIGIAETLHHLPEMGWMNAQDFSLRHIIIFIGAVLVYSTLTTFSCIISQNRFEKIDL